MDNSENIEENKNFEILSGQAGSGGGVGYIPLRNGFQEFVISNYIHANNTGIGQNAVSPSAVNDYIAKAFLLNRSLTVNRFAIRIQNLSATNVWTMRGGVMEFDTTTGYPTQISNAITFVTNAYQDIAYSTLNFSSGAYTTFNFTADVTLSANTWYFYGAQFISGTNFTSLSLLSHFSNSKFNVFHFPHNARRIAGTQTQQVDGTNMMLGYYDGSTTDWYLGHPFDLNENQNILNVANTNTQVGFKFEINLAADEIYINKILFYMQGQNNTHDVKCKIFSDLAGTKLVAESVTIQSRAIFTNGTQRHRYFYFAPPAKIKPYKSYYCMLEVVSGSATGTNPTTCRMFLIENEDFEKSFDSLNDAFLRVASGDTNFTERSTSSICPVAIIIESVKKTNRPFIGSM